MNPLLPFVFAALLLVVVTLVLLLWPFRRRSSGANAASPASGHPRSMERQWWQPACKAFHANFSRRQINAAIYRDELAELESDRTAGALAADDYEQARTELQRRLLEDSGNESAPAAIAPAGRSAPWAVALALPVAAALLYLWLGNPAALNPPPDRNFSAGDIERMVAGLAAKLEKEPGNIQGWAMLARSYKAMGRLDEAVRAYERTGSLLEEDANLLLDYADTLAASDAGFDARVLALIDKALQLDPVHPQGLWLRGTAHYEAGRYDRALADWEALEKLLPAGSESAQLIAANIAELKVKRQAASDKPRK